MGLLFFFLACSAVFARFCVFERRTPDQPTGATAACVTIF